MLRKTIAIIAALALALCVAGCSSSDNASKSGHKSKSSSSSEQVVKTDLATVKYVDKVEPTQGNAMFNFSLKNKTNATVIVAAENVVVNDEYNAGTLGGSAAPISPGNTGSVSVMFGYSVQTAIGRMDDIHSISCELVMRDNDSFDEVGRIPVSVEV